MPELRDSVTIDWLLSNGELRANTMPPVVILSRPTSTELTASDTWEQVAFTDTEMSLNAGFERDNGALKCLRSGYVFVAAAARMLWGGSGNPVVTNAIRVVKNSTEIGWLTDEGIRERGDGDATRLDVAGTVRVEADDELELQAYTSHHNDISIEASGIFDDASAARMSAHYVARDA